MDRGTFDALIREALQERAEKISMSEARKEQIYQAVSYCGQEEHFMRRHGKYKILVAAAALCIMGTMAVMAAGKIVGYSSHHNTSEPEFAAYGDLAQADEQAGFPVKAPEKFANGFAFDKGYLTEVNAHDENGEVLATFPEISVYYKKDGKSVTLDVEKVRPEKEESTTGNPRQVQYGDITMVYREDHYRFVPEDYVVTVKEQEAVDAGELYVSYGASETEDTTMCFLEWVEGDVQYLLLSHDTGLDMDAMVEMGKQVIDSPEL